MDHISETSSYSSYSVGLDERVSHVYVPGRGFVPQEPETFEIKNLRMIASRIGFAMLLYVLLSALGTLPVVLLFSWLGLPVQVNLSSLKVYGSEEMLSVISISAMLLKLGIPALILWGSFRRTVSFDSFDTPVKGKLAGISLPIVLGAGVAGSAMATALQNVLAAAGISVSLPAFSVSYEPLQLILSVILFVVLPPVLEELLFHGFILQGLRAFGDGIAIFVSALLFSLAHFNAVQGANALLMGLVIGYFVLRAGSVWIGVLLHFAVNAVSFLELLLYRSPLQYYSEMIADIASIVFAVCGLAALVVWIFKEQTAFTVPVPDKTELKALKRLRLCFGSAVMLLALLALTYFTLF